MSYKILILDTGKEWGGGTNSLIELLKRSDKNRYIFTVLFYNNYKKGTDSDIKTEIERLNIKFLLLDHGKQVVIHMLLKELARIVFFFNAKLKRYFIFLIDYSFRIKLNAEKIADTAKRLDIDLLYMNNQPSSNLEGIIAVRDAGIPCVQHSRIAAMLNAFEVDAVNKWLKKMICVSEGVRESFVRQGINESICTVVYNGIDPNIKPMRAVSEIRKKWGVGDDEILIGTVGSLIKRKRINDLIDAMAEMQRQDARGKMQDLKLATCNLKLSLKCMIVGDGPEKENLQIEARKKGLHERVIFTGFQSDAISYINVMDIFVLSSENEGLPRVILEAMLMAKPVVACNVTGSSELVIDGETGFLVSVKDPDALAAAMSRLIASSELRNTMGAMGRERVLEKFSMEAYITGVSKIFEEVLG